MPQNIQGSNEVMSRILTDLQPMKQLAWKNKKRWELDKIKGKRARFLLRQPKSIGRQGWIYRKLTKRQECMITNEPSSEDKLQQQNIQSMKQRDILRCVRSSYFSGKKSKIQEILIYSKDRRRADWKNNNSERVIAHNVKKEQMLGLKERRKRAANKGKLHSVSLKSFDSYDSSYSLSSFFIPSSVQRKLSHRLKRSPSSSYKKGNNLEDKFVIDKFKMKEQKIRETGKFLKKREAEDIATLHSNSHLKLRALKTEMKMSAIAEHLSDPSHHLSKEEKLAYMHELQEELKLFIWLLQQQMLVHSQEKLQDLAKMVGLPNPTIS
ncbi:uncharacterized protein LOC128337713 isoform X2 [Hemicordylus capensis]|nr:uncharacterized protein LOC128337713 isoform X2 [Hemicordylus capensis]XP_053134984.1 uncharacterized protein LOC128337713 isoform X2 [Hemicordylus capensis]